MSYEILNNDIFHLDFENATLCDIIHRIRHKKYEKISVGKVFYLLQSISARKHEIMFICAIKIQRRYHFSPTH